VDAGRSRVVAFVNPKEEAAPAAAPPGAEPARRRALAAAAKLGYPAHDYAAVDVGTQARPKRTDTTVVLESAKDPVGESKPRLTAVFHGARLASLLPTIKIPEAYLRDSSRRSPADWVLLAAKVVAIGAFVGMAVIVFLRLVRGGGFRWRRIVGPLLVALAGTVIAIVNSTSSIARAYQTEQPWSLFQIVVTLSLAISAIAVLAAAGFGFVLLSGARPGWRAALRRSGSLGDAFFRAAIGAAGAAGLARWVAVASSRYPSLFEPDPTLPRSLERWLPGYAGFWSVATAAFSLAAVAATVTLAARTRTAREPLWRALAVVAVLLALAPIGARSAGEFAAAWIPEILLAAWFAFVAFGLLKDHAAAWVFFGALYFGGLRAGELLVQPAQQDRAAGWTVALLVLIAAAVLVAGRRQRPEPLLAAGPVPEPIVPPPPAEVPEP
jgi:hypothetical protein